MGGAVGGYPSTQEASQVIYSTQQLHFTGGKTEVQRGPRNAQVTRVSHSRAGTRSGGQEFTLSVAAQPSPTLAALVCPRNASKHDKLPGGHPKLIRGPWGLASHRSLPWDSLLPSDDQWSRSPTWPGPAHGLELLKRLFLLVLAGQ